MQMLKTDVFESVLYAVPHRIAAVLRRMPEDIRAKTDEIRLRAGKPLCLTVRGRPLFVTQSGAVAEVPSKDGVVLSETDISECIRLMCNNSVYAHAAEINNGYIALRHGHRAGVAGNFSGENVYEFSSVNIRLARQITGAADFLRNMPVMKGVLIAGAPGTGKTTVLRDLIRAVSSGEVSESRRVSVIDTRGELSAVSGGVPALDLGANTDVLFGIDKPRGIELALRALNPEIIAFDEIGTPEELAAVRKSLNGGAAVFTTAHIGALDDLSRRGVAAELIKGGFVGTVAVLSGRDYSDKKVYKAKELLKWIF